MGNLFINLIKIMKLTLTLFCLLESVKSGYDNSLIVPMGTYPKNYRTLNGWECFKAEGKFCHDENHKSMIKVTGSSNFGHGVCCKPEYAGQHCNSDTDHKCSQPVAAINTAPTF